MKTTLSNLLILSLLGLVSGCARFPVTTESAFEQLRNNVKSAETVDLEFGIARLTERNGSPAEAKAAYMSILNDHPEHSGALHRLGVMMVKDDQTAQAVDYLEQAIAHSTNDGTSHELRGDLGYVYYLMGDLDQAETNLFSAHRQKPDDKRVTNNLAIVVGLKGDLSRSLELFRSCTTEAEALASFAFVQTRVGDLEGAKASYHRALESDSDLKVAANGLIELHQKTAKTSKASKRTANSRNRARDEAKQSMSFREEFSRSKPLVIETESYSNSLRKRNKIEPRPTAEVTRKLEALAPIRKTKAQPTSELIGSGIKQVIATNRTVPSNFDHKALRSDKNSSSVNPE